MIAYNGFTDDTLEEVLTTLLNDEVFCALEEPKEIKEYICNTISNIESFPKDTKVRVFIGAGDFTGSFTEKDLTTDKETYFICLDKRLSHGYVMNVEDILALLSEGALEIKETKDKKVKFIGELSYRNHFRTFIRGDIL